MPRRRKRKPNEKVGYRGARVTVLVYGPRTTTIRTQHGYPQDVKTNELEDDPGPG